MKLEEWMKQNRWDSAKLARELGVARLTIRAAMKQQREISARLALKIQEISRGQVKIRDLLPPLDK
jgi:plasmid maintenance system antidote protein VapI